MNDAKNEKKDRKEIEEKLKKMNNEDMKKNLLVVLKKLEDEIVKMKNKDIPKLIPKTNPKKTNEIFDIN